MALSEMSPTVFSSSSPVSCRTQATWAGAPSSVRATVVPLAPVGRDGRGRRREKLGSRPGRAERATHPRPAVPEDCREPGLEGAWLVGLLGVGQTAVMTTPRELADRFHEHWLSSHPLAATSYGIPGYDHLMPDDSDAGHEALRAGAEEILKRAREIDAETLSPADAVTLGCTIAHAEAEIAAVESAPYEHTVTAMPFSGPANFLAIAARSVLVDEEAATNYLTRLEASSTWIRQLAGQLNAGAKKGRYPVEPLVEQAIAWAESLLSEDAPAPLLAPEPPKDWSGADGWKKEREGLARQAVKPALAEWLETIRALRGEARPAEKAGLVHLPGGAEDYARALRTHTTLPLTAEEIHETGLSHIATLEERAVRLGVEIGLADLGAVHQALRSSAGRARPEEAIAAARRAVSRAESRAQEIFPPPLPPPCQVTPMPPVVAEAGMAPHYTPPRLDGGRPGTFWFNTSRPTAGTGWDLEGVAFHEAVPGHHLQLSRLQLLDHLPALQRQRSVTVFSEGWGLYSEQLAEEIGLYSGTESLLGSITTSLMRAARLVLDTGMHAFGWSRERAIQFYLTHVPLPVEFLENEIDRYICNPGQALAYLTGKIEILKLREKAEHHLGADFRLPEFHAAILDQGPLPMPVLHASVDSWLATRAS